MHKKAQTFLILYKSYLFRSPVSSGVPIELVEALSGSPVCPLAHTSGTAFWLLVQAFRFALSIMGGFLAESSICSCQSKL